MNNSGHRLSSRSRAGWEQLADEQGRLVSVRREDLITFLDKGLRHLYPNLSKSERDLASLLTGFTRDRVSKNYIGWTDGGIPVVCASNRHLAEAHDCSESKLSRQLNKLADCGLISFNDRASRRRGVQQDASGEIVERFGIVLSLLKIRFDEIVDAARNHTAHQHAIRHIATSIKSLRPKIRAKIEAGERDLPSKDWSVYWQAYEAVPPMPRGKAQKEILLDIFDELEMLHEEVKFALIDDLDVSNSIETTSHMDGCPSQNDEVNTDTNPNHFVNSNQMRNCANAQSTEFTSDIAKRDEEASKGKPVAADLSKQPEKSEFAALPFEKAIAAFPHLCQNLDDFGLSRTPENAWKVAQMLAPELGISQDAMQSAVNNMGLDRASIAIGVIHGNRLDIGSPGGYLRAMIGREIKGELHLTRAIFGRLARNSGRKQQTGLI